VTKDAVSGKRVLAIAREINSLLRYQSGKKAGMIFSARLELPVLTFLIFEDSRLVRRRMRDAPRTGCALRMACG